MTIVWSEENKWKNRMISSKKFRRNKPELERSRECEKFDL
jgi:hypothetical protein